MAQDIQLPSFENTQQAHSETNRLSQHLKTSIKTTMVKFKRFKSSENNVWFLTSCLKYKVCPPTLIAKPPQHGNEFLKVTVNDYKTAALKASMSYLSIACKDAKEELTYKSETFVSFIKPVTQMTTNEEFNIILQALKTQMAKFSSTSKMTTRFKLRKLLQLHNKVDEEDLVGQPKKQLLDKEGNLKENDAPKHTKNRRFTKRSKHKRISCKLARENKLATINNLSSFHISKDMENILNKGLTFVPNRYKINKTELLADLDKYEGRMLWKEYFHKDNLIKDFQIRSKHKGLDVNSNCNTCGYNARNNKDLREHVKETHENIKDFRCNTCEYAATNKSHLTAHIEAVHGQLTDIEYNRHDFVASDPSNLDPDSGAIHNRMRG